MKTTVDLPEAELAEAMRHTKAKTKTAAVAFVVADYNRRQRLATLADKLGTFKDFMTRDDLRKMRVVAHLEIVRTYALHRTRNSLATPAPLCLILHIFGPSV